jgi:Glycosyl hydrolases family 2
MTNRIVKVLLEDRSLDPVSAEVWITVHPETLTPATELRGRLMGPSCPYASTVEIAYPLSPLKRSEQQLPGALRCRVVIPEPSLWDVQSPFLYSGPIELWQDGQRIDSVSVRHGLRKMRVGPQGLLLNGKPLTLRGRVVGGPTETEALALRGEGCNLLVPRDEAEETWDVADRFGFLVLGDRPRPEHASCLRALLADPARGLEIVTEGVGFRLLYGEVELGRIVR